jgi:hypothetical protein
MQTFLPYADYDASARSLDRQRLGKQRVEAYQIAKVLLTATNRHHAGVGWSKHPAVLMWAGHVGSLCDYGFAMCQEWTGRGYVDNLSKRFLEYVIRYELEGGPPEWIGWEQFHRSHRSNLIRKNAEHYRPQFGDVPDDLPYVWPNKVLY